MNEQIGDDKHRIARLVTDADIDGFYAVFGHMAYHTPQLHRDSRPLVFLDAAVIMGFKQCHAVVLIQRNGTDINTRCIQMGSCQVDTRTHALFTDYEEYNSFISIDFVILIAGMQLHAPLISSKALGLCHFLQTGNCVALGLGFIQKRFIALRIVHHGSLIPIAHAVPACLFVIKQFVFHYDTSFPEILRVSPESYLKI